MGAFGPLHWMILAVVVLLLFGGKGKIASIMGDTAKGIKAFKDGLKDDENKKDDEKPAASASNAGTLPRTDAEREAVRREEDKHTAA